MNCSLPLVLIGSPKFWGAAQESEEKSNLET
jgi:hypothetical protein